MSFQQVVHPVRTEEAEVVEALGFPGGRGICLSGAGLADHDQDSDGGDVIKIIGRIDGDLFVAPSMRLIFS